MSNDGETLRRPVRTDQDTVIRLRPFEVQNVSCDARWDPQGDPLRVYYEINDPNSRIRSGRILYTARGPDGEEVTLYRQALERSQFVHARCYELRESERWDGTIREGITDRIGEKITADLSFFSVTVEVWNTREAEPAARVRGGQGRTEREGEYLSSGVANVEVDAIVQGRWGSEWVIPYDDPDEPDKGEATISLRVKNVRENTSARIVVSRINEIANAENDYLYVDTSWGPEEQPGLQGLVVRNGRVLQSDGSDPKVRFNVYEEHWKYPGINFYQFGVAFGENGYDMVASERDYVNNERDCLNMRFTVLIECSSLGDEYRTATDQLWRFLKRETKYFRPYKLMNRVRNIDDWIKHYRNRYIVTIQGHGGVYCAHSDHPTRTVGSGRRARTERMDMYHRGFAPDNYYCPTGVEETEAGRREHRWALRHYGHPFGGCGNSSHVYHSLSLSQDRSTRRKMLAVSLPNQDTSLRPQVALGKRRGRSDERVIRMLGVDDNGPRLLFYAGGCRSMLSKNLGERFTRNGTKHYHGWVWSVWIRENRRFCLDLFRRWIKGTEGDPPASECELSRFLPAYRAAAARSFVNSHPRIMEGRNVLSIRAAPDRAEGASS